MCVFLAKWICQLSVFVLKETFAESKHLHCKAYPEVMSQHLDKTYATIKYQWGKKPMDIFVYTPPPKLHFRLLGGKLQIK